MNTKKSTSGFLFGLAIFTGLLPLAFSFSQTGIQLLLETKFRGVIWCGQAITLLILLLSKGNIGKHQLVGLSILFVLVPLTFTFNEKGAYFLILNKYTSTILSWAIAGVLLRKLLLLEHREQVLNS